MENNQAQLKESEQQRAVSDLQSFLRRLSHTYVTIPFLVSDGIFGVRTQQAVEEFQRLMGMPVTGVVNTQTWNAIVSEMNANQIRKAKAPSASFFPRLGAFSAGERGDAVYAAQIMLKNLSELSQNLSDVDITGVMDETTVPALKTLQAKSNTEICGELNKETWGHLARFYELHLDLIHPLFRRHIK